MCLAIDMELNGDPKHGPPSYHEKLDIIFEREGGHNVNEHARDPELNIHGGYNAGG